MKSLKNRKKKKIETIWFLRCKNIVLLNFSPIFVYDDLITIKVIFNKGKKI